MVISGGPVLHESLNFLFIKEKQLPKCFVEIRYLKQNLLSFGRRICRARSEFLL